MSSVFIFSLTIQFESWIYSSYIIQKAFFYRFMNVCFPLISDSLFLSTHLHISTCVSILV